MEAFSLQKVVEMLEEVSGGQLTRGQMNMANEVKLHSPIHSSIGYAAYGLVLWRKSESCLLTNASCSTVVIGASHQFGEHTSQR